MDRTQFLLIISTWLLATILWVGVRSFWGWRIGRWARAQGYQLISFQGARFNARPWAWYRRDTREAFRIVVADGQDRERVGWLSFGSRWLPSSRTAAIQWDDAAQR
jgi:hypothetical protein